MLKNVISGIKGGKMTRAEANEKGKQILKEVNKQCDRIREEAQANGTWQMGLDSNNHLFKEVHKKAIEKLKKIEEMIDEE